MVNAALSIGASVGVLLSAGFVYWQVGRYAAPQVAESRFDERKEMIGYTAGLFAGIPLVVPLLFLFQSIPPFEIGGIALYLTLLVAGCELAQWLLLRSAYFGRDGSGPFYALGFRAGLAGILILALVTQYFSGASVSGAALAGILAISLALLALQAVCAILALPNRADRPGRTTGPFTAVPLEAIGFFFLGYAAGSGPTVAVVGGLLIAAMAGWLYRSIADPNLSVIPPPGGKVRDPEAPSSSFGRVDRR
ncbi:MAG TPA: hypothetical protein VGS23_01690 [Thermoplasmata archaeon]|nr:hypothetical protein [Thermoplasmata archaeon]